MSQPRWEHPATGYYRTIIYTPHMNPIVVASNEKDKQGVGNTHGKRMTISTEDGKKTLYAPFAPKDIEYGGLGYSWEQIERSGRSPLLVRGKKNLPTLNFSLLFARSHDPEWNYTAGLEQWEDFANTTQRLKIKYGGGRFENRLWRMTSFSFSSEERHPVTSVITRAILDIELTMASDVVLSVGPISGGVKPPAAKPKPKPKPKPTPAKKPTPPKKSVRYHTLKKGETLISLAVKYYRDASKWRKIADANKIKNVRTIPIGKKLRIP